MQLPVHSALPLTPPRPAETQLAGSRAPAAPFPAESRASCAPCRPVGPPEADQRRTEALIGQRLDEQPRTAQVTQCRCRQSRARPAPPCWHRACNFCAISPRWPAAYDRDEF